MYGLPVQQHKNQADSWTDQGWNIQFRRNFNDWEIDTVIEFFSVLDDFKGTKDDADRLWRNKDNKGIFRVSSAYKFLNQGSQHSADNTMAIETKIPLKVVCFTWLLAREAVLTEEKSQEERIFSSFKMLHVRGRS
ncbi:hypothetical protein FXO38_13806 [Capsicum annuum]|nr:hypothetical protein FXO38_13806 [Capsicum annuum]